MKKVLAAFLFVVVLSLFFFCEKRLFKTVRLTGNVKDWYTNTIDEGKVVVLAQDAFSYKEETISMTSFGINTDGSFDKAFKAARSGEYYITIGNKSHQGSTFHLNIKDGSTHDFGSILLGHEFICKVKVTYNSYREVSIHFASQSPNEGFHPYANAIFYDRLSYSKEEFEKSNRTYNLSYQTMGPSIAEFTNIAIPIGQSDTVFTEVKF